MIVHRGPIDEHADEQADDGPSTLDRTRRRAYLRWFVPGIVAYALAIGLVVAVTDDGTTARWAWYLVPVLPLVWIGVAIGRDALTADEYQQQLIFRSMAVGFGAAMFAAVVTGMLDAADVDVGASGWIVFGAGMSAWAVHGAFTQFGLRP